MKKAYDRLYWDFILAMLKAINFSLHWINLIKQCIYTISYQIQLNGSRANFFSLIWLKASGSTFTLYVCNYVVSGFIRGALVDCIIFVQGTNDVQHNVLKILRWYCNLFGQIVNFDKSKVFFYCISSEHSINRVRSS